MQLHKKYVLFIIIPILLLGCKNSLNEDVMEIPLFAKNNLVAWCIIPFDAKNRSPEERAEMLNELGIEKLGYDWRNEHLPTFPGEIEVLRKNNIEKFPELLSIKKDLQYEKSNVSITDLYNDIIHYSHDVSCHLGFTGVVVTDWEDVERLWKYHRVVKNMKEAVYFAIKAGIDVSMAPFDPSFHPLLVELVREGRVSDERIDLSVARVLRLKLQLGLFDHPFPCNDRFDRIGHPDHQKAALDAARESLVLMKNDNALLPIKPEDHGSLPNCMMILMRLSGWDWPERTPHEQSPMC